MINKTSLLFVFVISALALLNIDQVVAQHPLALGQWRTHLPYNSAYFVADAGNKVYCGTNVTLFYYDKTDNSITTYSKVNGLSDIGITSMDYSTAENVLFVSYENSNIDLIYNDGIFNLSDIKRKNITGDKSVYNVTFNGRFAYVACGFGIVVVDLQKREIKETYYIGPNGNNIAVFDIAIAGDSIYAATAKSVLKAGVNDPGINNYANWSSLIEDNSSSNAYTLLAFNGTVLLINHAFNYETGSRVDSLITYNPQNWNFGALVNNGNFKTNSIREKDGKFIITNGFSINVWNSGLNSLLATYSLPDADMKSAVMDNQGKVWLADKLYGLVKFEDQTHYSKIIPTGPESNLVCDLSNDGETIWVAHGSPHWVPFIYEKGMFSSYSQYSWHSFNSKNNPSNIVGIDNVLDISKIAIDPNDKNHLFIGSYYKGLIEMRNGEIVHYYNNLNSTLQAPFGSDTKTSGMTFDNESNLWVVNSQVASILHKLSPDGTWKSYPFFPSFQLGVPNNFMWDLLIDSYNQKWISWNGVGLLVFDDQTNTYRLLSSGTRNGNLPDLTIKAIVEDHDGQIWVGTGKGIAVFYSAGNIISDSTNDAQQILIEGDYINQYLLASEQITAIAVDGANRKWIGTGNAGIFLVSPDGTQQILNFTEDNSPLLSNYITAISINGTTGEVFIGTDKGLISYQSDATEGEDGCHDVTVFPNPVRPEYHGTIAIKGVVKNGNIKVTDIGGNIVYETTANGGMATWNGLNFSGNRVQTGVYLVFVTNDDGENTCVTKLLFMN